MAAVITFRDVTFSPGAGRRVLERFSLEVRAGEVVALVGRSGAGKSTILKLINRVLAPDQGSVEVDGRSTAEWDPYALRRHVGYVLQEVGLFPHMRVEQNVGLLPRLAGHSPDAVRRRAHELLDLVGLPPATYADRWPQELSGGERQRVGVARALALDPPILLMDEPFGALDPVTRAEMHREFRRIQARVGKTVIIVTHDMNEAFALAERICVLQDGRLIAAERPSVIARSADPRVRLFLDAYAVPAIDARPGIA